jgi:hypothetical protein
MRQRTVDIEEPNVSTYSDDALRKLRQHPDASALTVALINEVLELRASARGKPIPVPTRRCGVCGKWTRESTAACDYCDSEDK